MNRIYCLIAILLTMTTVTADLVSAQTPIYIEAGSVIWDPATNEGTFPVYMTSTVAIAGFQFDVVFDSPTGILSAASGGLAETYGYDIGSGSVTVLGFSLTLTEIPPTPTLEVLVNITITTTTGIPDFGNICLENPVFSDVTANSVGVTIGPCSSLVPTFRRGDCNLDTTFNLADVIYLLAQLFSGGALGSCQDSCDSNDDGNTNIADAVYSLAALFTSGPPPLNPGPTNCGIDPTPDGLQCDSGTSCL
ncbi:MAG: hypothetical protein H8E43_06645 [Planctomycetia bacterium]|nr:hypothetical protein [Planctomycetia bacterium]MBL6914602.1 hypothetical protein [Planctomycetota bacterium]HCW45478.1 hypothetical protein [Planctomycetota bacterium]